MLTNYTTAVFLINKHARAITATYEADENAKREIFKTLDQSIKAGDLVTVQTNTRHKMTVVKVVETDVDVDFNSTTPIFWVIDKVDPVAVEALMVQEAEAIKAIKSAELRQKRDDMAAALFKDHAATLKALPIADMSGDDSKPAIEAA